MKVASIIYNILKANADVTAAVADRIYPLLAPAGVTTPFVVHLQTGNRPHDSKNGPSTQDNATAEVFVVHENFDTVEEITETIRTALDRFSGTVNGIDVVSIQYLDELPDFDMETGFYSKKTVWKITANR